MFSPAEQDLLVQASRLVGLAPARVENEYVRCHELARAVGEQLDLHVVDGSYGAVEHSWLLLPVRNTWVMGAPRGFPAGILDVYVPGRLPMVQLVAIQSLGFPTFYRERESRRDIREAVLAVLRAVMTKENL